MKKKERYCKNCGKPTFDLDFCNNDCFIKHRERHPKENRIKKIRDSASEEMSATEYMKRRQSGEIERETETAKTEEIDEKTINCNDLNIELIRKALATKTEIRLIPRRSHTIKGFPIRYDTDTYRIYIDTGRDIESALLSEIGLFSFPRELYYRRSQK